MRFVTVVGLTSLALLTACGGGGGGGGGASPSAGSSRPTTASAAIALLDHDSMHDAHCLQTGTSVSASSNGNITGFCNVIHDGSTYSLEQKYSVTVTIHSDVESRTLTEYADSIQIGANTYYSLGLNPSGNAYTRGTTTAATGWSSLFFAGATFSNFRESSVDGTAAWVVHATSTPGPGVTKNGDLYIRESDGFLLQVDLMTAAGATTEQNRLKFSQFNVGERIIAPS